MLPGWSDRYFEINGVSLHAYHIGSIDRPPLVLVHGFSDNGLCWQEEAEELKSEFDIWMPEMRGHGSSTRLKPSERFDMVADLVKFIQVCDLVRPTVAGHSMGASIAFHLAARHPDLPSALILEDPPWFNEVPDHYKGDQKQPSNFSHWVENLQNQTLAEIISECREEHPTWPESTALRWCEAKKQLDPNFVITENIPHSNWKEAILKITCPTLLITADPTLGGIVTPEMGREAVKMNPNVQLAHFPETGHHIRFARHEEVMQKIKEFLREVR